MEGLLSIRAREGLAAYAIDNYGQKLRPITCTYTQGRYQLPLTKSVSSFALLLE